MWAYASDSWTYQIGSIHTGSMHCKPIQNSNVFAAAIMSELELQHSLVCIAFVSVAVSLVFWVQQVARWRPIDIGVI